MIESSRTAEHSKHQRAMSENYAIQTTDSIRIHHKSQTDSAGRIPKASQISGLQSNSPWRPIVLMFYHLDLKRWRNFEWIHSLYESTHCWASRCFSVTITTLVGTFVSPWSLTSSSLLFSICSVRLRHILKKYFKKTVSETQAIPCRQSSLLKSLVVFEFDNILNLRSPGCAEHLHTIPNVGNTEAYINTAKTRIGNTRGQSRNIKNTHRSGRIWPEKFEQRDSTHRSAHCNKIHNLKYSYHHALQTHRKKKES